MMSKILPFLVLVLILLSACKKPGCTNELAVNYSEKAKTNDGSCQFEAKVSFWLNNNVSATLTNSYNVTSLHIYIDEELVGMVDPSKWSVGPACDNGNFTVVVDMGLNPIQKSEYVVNDQAGTTQFSGEIELLPQSCNNIQMKW